eukprot:257545_1
MGNKRSKANATGNLKHDNHMLNISQRIWCNIKHIWVEGRITRITNTNKGIQICINPGMNWAPATSENQKLFNLSNEKERTNVGFIVKRIPFQDNILKLNQTVTYMNEEFTIKEMIEVNKNTFKIFLNNPTDFKLCKWIDWNEETQQKLEIFEKQIPRDDLDEFEQNDLLTFGYIRTNISPLMKDNSIPVEIKDIIFKFVFIDTRVLSL